VKTATTAGALVGGWSIESAACLNDPVYTEEVKCKLLRYRKKSIDDNQVI